MTPNTLNAFSTLLLNLRNKDASLQQMAEAFHGDIRSFDCITPVLTCMLDLLEVPPHSERYSRIPYLDRWEKLEKSTRIGITDRLVTNWVTDCLEMYCADFPFAARSKRRLLLALPSVPRTLRAPQGDQPGPVAERPRAVIGGGMIEAIRHVVSANAAAREQAEEAEPEADGGPKMRRWLLDRRWEKTSGKPDPEVKTVVPPDYDGTVRHDNDGVYEEKPILPLPARPPTKEEAELEELMANLPGTTGHSGAGYPGDH